MYWQLKSWFYLLSHVLLVIVLAVQTKPVYCQSTKSWLILVLARSFPTGLWALLSMFLVVLLGASAKSVNETQSVVFLRHFLSGGFQRDFPDMGHACVSAGMWSSGI